MSRRPDPPMTFNDVFRTYYSAMVFFARRLLQDKCKAEEIVCDAFMKLHKTGSQFVKTKTKAFLYIVIRNACMNLLAHDGMMRRKQAAFIELQTEACESPFQEIVRTELMHELIRVLGSLPPQCKKCIELSYFGGKKHKEIAELLGLSVHTVKNQIRRGELLTRKRLVNLSDSDGFL